MMRFCFIFVLSITFVLSVSAQDFEGKITFKMYYTPRNEAKIDTAAIQKAMGTRSECLMKKGAYVQTTDSEFLNWQLYLPKENRLYFTDAATPGQLFYYRGDKAPNIGFTYEIVENAATIQGHVCHLLKYKSEESEMHFYYAADMPLNSKHFKDFTFTNRNKITELMQSVFLKNEYFSPDFTAVMEADSITPMKIPDSAFTKPGIAMVREK